MHNVFYINHAKNEMSTSKMMYACDAVVTLHHRTDDKRSNT